jgi:hypothetical protein
MGLKLRQLYECRETMIQLMTNGCDRDQVCCVLASLFLRGRQFELAPLAVSTNCFASRHSDDAMDRYHASSSPSIVYFIQLVRCHLAYLQPLSLSNICYHQSIGTCLQITLASVQHGGFES